MLKRNYFEFWLHTWSKVLSEIRTTQLGKPLAVLKANVCLTASFSLAWTIYHSCILLPLDLLLSPKSDIIQILKDSHTLDSLMFAMIPKITPWAGCPSFHQHLRASCHTVQPMVQSLLPAHKWSQIAKLHSGRCVALLLPQKNDTSQKAGKYRGGKKNLARERKSWPHTGIKHITRKTRKEREGKNLQAMCHM